MPIVQFHLVASAYESADLKALLEEASHFYAATLYPDMDPPPLERVRAFVSETPPGHWATAGTLVSEGGVPAPYFTCLSLSGRSDEQLQRLMAGMTALIVRHLGCAQSLVRGMLVPIEPSHWFIAGQPASTVRSAEVARRAAKATEGDA